MTHAVAAIRLDGVTRRYGGGDSFALEPTTMEVAAASWTAITGRSGSGKTTLVNLMSALDRPDSGQAWIFGCDLATLSEAALSDVRRDRLGLVYQRFLFLDHLTVWQNVTCRLVPAGVPARARRERALAILGELGLRNVADRLPRDLSGGEQQRVAFARALCGAPQVLIADEPTSNVDTATGAVIVDRLRRLRAGGTTIVTATHDAALVASADVHHVMADGRIV